MIEFRFTPWRLFTAFRDRKVTREVMRYAAAEFKKELVQGIKNPPKTGRIYQRKNGKHQASRGPSEYPANETGRLAASVRSESTADKAVGGTTIFYGKFLREGTRIMKRRKMSDTAMGKIVPRACARLRGWVYWKFDG